MSDMDGAVDDAIVLVTGASGYIASHLVQLLLSKGYRVRGTVRSLKNEKKVKPLRDLCPTAKHPLELVEADLTDPESWMRRRTCTTSAFDKVQSWMAANKLLLNPSKIEFRLLNGGRFRYEYQVSGCTYVHHVASPFPAEAPKHEDEIIRPAVDGTLAVLKACSRHHVKRVVLTSSVAAIFGDVYDKDVPGRVFSEADWTTAETAKDAYVKSKTLAEKAAWNYVEQLSEGERFELAVINPVFVLGPILGAGDGTSLLIIKKLMEREMPLVPRFNFSIVDVRDVALAHVRAMKVPEAAGHRHITFTGQSIWMHDMAVLLDKEFRPMGYNVPTSNCPYFFLWLTSKFDKSVKLVMPLYNKEQRLDNTRMRNTLGITPIDVNKTIIDMTYDMIEKGLIKKTSKYRKN